MLKAIETSALGEWVAHSLWGYPIVLTLHAVGMAALMGVSLMVCARVYGFAGDAPLSQLTRAMGYAWAGLAVNAASGAALFAGRATKHGANPAFLLKMVFIAGAVAAMIVLLRRLDGREHADGGAKLWAGASAGLWIAALISGRLIGYLQDGI